MRKLISVGLAVLLGLFGAGLYISHHILTKVELKLRPKRYSATVNQLNWPSRIATWPWPGAKPETLHRGVTHWKTRDTDGTTADLLEFDFDANPALRWRIFDQDQDDAKPFDNRVEYSPRGVGQMTRQLNKSGKVIAAWNGAFFGYVQNTGGRIGFHIAPVVLNGKVHAWGMNHRWTFGVKYINGHPQFKVMLLPKPDEMARQFDWAAGGVQCLIKDGKPLRIEPFPVPNELVPKPPLPCTAADAGAIPLFDQMRSTRASIGWTQDSRKMYLLFVQEPDEEIGSIQALLHDTPPSSPAAKGGWMVLDIQHFWQAMKMPNAINSDAGNVGQMVYLRPDGKYEMALPHVGVVPLRQTYNADFSGAPQGGALMYIFVSE